MNPYVAMVLQVLAELFKVIANGQLSQQQKQAVVDATVAQLQSPVKPTS